MELELLMDNGSDQPIHPSGSWLRAPPSPSHPSLPSLRCRKTDSLPEAPGAQLRPEGAVGLEKGFRPCGWARTLTNKWSPGERESLSLSLS